MADIKKSGVCKDASYLRKIKKPIIEKKRRDRINTCLSQLKDILLKTMNQSGNTQIAKLDKADILEMTVSHLQQIQYQQMAITMATNTSALSQYNEGYSECAEETVRYLHSTQGSRRDLATRVDKHLSGIVRPVTTPNNPVTVKTEPLSVNVRSNCKSSVPSSHNSSLLMTVPSNGLPHTAVCSVPATYSNNGHNFQAGRQNAVLALPTCSTARLSPSQTPEKVWRPW